MQLMIQRGQKSGLFRPIFNLWAKFELTPEEWALIHKYGTQRVVLKEGNAAFEFWLSTRISFVIAFITMVVINIRWGIVVSLELGVFVFVVGAFIIYHSIRTQIWVEDILNGQYFTCRSVAALIEKEEAITKMASVFRSFLETMKNWGGKEIIEIEPYKPATLRIIENTDEAA